MRCYSGTSSRFWRCLWGGTPGGGGRRAGGGGHLGGAGAVAAAPPSPRADPPGSATSSARSLFQRVFSPAAPIQPGSSEEADRHSSAGSWSEVSLFDGQQWDEKLCATAPNICGLLRESSEVCGVGADATVCGTKVVVSIFRLLPGAHVLPHTGVTNRRLIMQYALKGSAGVKFRVGAEFRPYGGDGQAIVFDDSFEHEVVHNGSETRYVLYAVLQHPDVNVAECGTGEAAQSAAGNVQPPPRTSRAMPRLPRS